MKFIRYYNLLEINLKNYGLISKSIVCGLTKRFYTKQSEIIFKSRYEVEIPEISMPELLFRDIKKFGNRPAMTCGVTGRTLKYVEVQELYHRMASAFLSSSGCNLNPGDTIGMVLPNLPEFLVASCGALSAGLTLTFTNPLYKPDDILQQFKHVGAKLLVTIPPFIGLSDLFLKALPNYQGTVLIGGDGDSTRKIFSYKSLLTENHKASLPKINLNDVAILPFSSGTTGPPKAVMLTHKNLVSNLLQCSHPTVIEYCDPNYVGGSEAILAIPPFFHIYGFNGVLNISILAGHNCVTLPKFTPEDYVKALIKYKPTMLFIVPTLMSFMTTHPSVKSEYLAAVKYVVVGSSAATPALQASFLKKCNHPIRILHGYGMTETSPGTFVSPMNNPLSKAASVGQLVPNTEARIISVDTGADLRTNESGELWVRGPQIMKGYYKNEEATKQIVDNDGWLHTGDVAYFDDDNYLFIVDRIKSLIKVKGLQVSPTELENIITEIPEVVDVAVVGIPHDKLGEAPKAYVVKRPNANISEEQVAQYVEGKVLKYKQLVGGVRFVKAIPRNHNGKLIKGAVEKLD